ncbi:MAG: hypothetical protein JSS82_13525 [Bacteroidetes bacterium]|nr:hypothetical protein [Bacteroidota bacterium]
MKKKKETRGGSGRGQGRHLKYGEETVPVVIRVPVSKVKEFRQYAALKLSEWLQGSS